MNLLFTFLVSRFLVQLFLALALLLIHLFWLLKVQGTNDSSIVSKCSMNERGYFKDDFLQYFIVKPSRRSPLINRGYYIRAEAINHALTSFLNIYGAQRRQIISLGAGFDSTFFRLKSQNLMENVVYIEVDFVELMKRKLNCIKHAKELRGLLNPDLILEAQTEGNGQENIVLNTVDYKLLGVDLTSPVSLTRVFEAVGVDFSLPTFILSEVVLTYLQPNHSSAVIGWAAEKFQDSMFVTYEQVEPADAFGTFMCNHFKKLGCPLRSIETYPSIRSQVQRYYELGWTETVSCDMNYFFYNLVSSDECLRVEALEPFDEYEEFHLKCSHYILLTAFNGPAVRNCSDAIWKVTEYDTSLSNEFSNDNCRIIKHQQNGYLLKGYRSSLPTLVTPTTGGLGQALQSNSESCSRTDNSVMHLKPIGTSEAQDILSDCTLSAVENMDASMTGWCQMIGHTATPVILGGQTFLVLAGGFGMSKGRHQRLNHIALAHHSCFYNDGIQETVNDCETEGRIVRAQLTEQVFQRMYHTATCIGGNKIILFGGRTSPVQCFSDISLIEVSMNSENPERMLYIDISNKLTDLSSSNVESPSELRNPVHLTCETLKSSGGGPCPRWKHSASFSVGVAEPRLYIFGGRSLEQRCLGDCWALDTQKIEWTEVVSSSDCLAPVARHSHTSDIWRDDQLVVAGGLGENLYTLASIHVLDTRTLQWRVLNTSIQSRYSHTSLVHTDDLILVGGVSCLSPSPGVTIVNLVSGSVRHLNVIHDTLLLTDVVMLHNHSMFQLKQDGEPVCSSSDVLQMTVVGGGGNCFSFGTHLNRRPMTLTIPLSFLLTH